MRKIAKIFCSMAMSKCAREILVNGKVVQCAGFKMAEETKARAGLLCRYSTHVFRCIRFLRSLQIQPSGILFTFF